MAVVTERGEGQEATPDRDGDRGVASAEAIRTPSGRNETRARAAESGTPSRAARMWEWFSRRRAMAKIRSESLPAWRANAQYRQLARISAELGQHAQGSLLESGKSDAVAAELYRESIYWALRALAHGHLRASGVETEPPLDGVERPRSASLEAEISTLWQSSDRELLLRTAGAPEVLSELESMVIAGSFSSFAELPLNRQASGAARLRAFASRLVEACDAPKDRLDRLWYERLLRLAMLFGTALVLVILALFVASQRERRSDLAAGKPWRASSQGYTACLSPQQSCERSSGYFFHTSEEDEPWLEIDLGASQNFSAVRVKNRTDCCRDRATPLIVEVSEDHERWKTVATRPSPFTSWRADFEPERARWVRLRAARRTILHLSEVRVLP
jgi:hypothetical protein